MITIQGDLETRLGGVDDLECLGLVLYLDGRRGHSDSVISHCFPLISSAIASLYHKNKSFHFLNIINRL